MKLKYKILWIEDEESSIRIKARNIRRFLENEYGFECLVKDITILDYEEFETQYIHNSEMKNSTNIEEFDLLLVDFNLGEEEHTGDKLIQIVRDGNIYSEILFYSSDLDSLKEKLQEHFIDGVFTSSRDELEDKIKKLIRITIKKVQDVNNLRGLIMAEVAELDRIKERIIIGAPETFKIQEYIVTTLRKSYDDNIKQVSKFSEEKIEIILKKLYVDSDKKLRAICKVKNTFDEKAYRKNILSVRNKFAHVDEKSGKDINGMDCQLIGDIPFTEEKCIEIRKDIKKYKKLLEEIEQNICAL